MNADTRAELERAALRYLETKPWEKLRDDGFFGVADAETGLDGWASVAGSDGEEFGLGIYMGDEGRRVLEKTLALDIDIERQNESADVIALAVADEAEAGDFREGTKLDGQATVSGKKVFPIVFRKPPGGSARALKDREALFLARALDAVTRSAEISLDADDVLDERGGRLRLSLSGKGAGLAIDRSYDEPRTGLLDVRADLEQALHEAPRQKRLLVGFQDATLSVFDPKERKLLHRETLADDPSRAAERLLELLAGKGPIDACLPREIWTDAPSLEAALLPVAPRLGLKVSVKLELKELRRGK